MLDLTGRIFGQPQPAERSQLELQIERRPQQDRNFNRGGRSFYFFDFDDNVAFLSTCIYIFQAKTRKEIALTSGEFAQISPRLGKPGPYADYELDFDEEKGSFRCFRDKNLNFLERVLRKPQPFVEDLAHALGYPDFHWQGPSWSCFYHATFNRRPVAVITARGHAPQTICNGIKLFVDRGYLPYPPNYLAVYPVSHLGTRKILGDQELNWTTPALKKAAIVASVRQALKIYGDAPHRFGMSDDDPRNVELIIEAMAGLKAQYPHMGFFVIETHKGKFHKREVFTDHVEAIRDNAGEQLSLFN